MNTRFVDFRLRLVCGVLLLGTITGVCFAEDRDPTRWEKAIKSFEKADQQTLPPPNAILFIGSSTIVGWDLKKCFPNRATINRGFGGSEIADATYYAERVVFPYKPKAIVFYSGDNDIANKNTAEQVLEDFKEFVSTVRKKLPDTPIIALSVKPSIARRKFLDTMREANRLLAEYCKSDPTLRFVDVFPEMLDANGEPRADLLREDRLHMNDQGYALFTARVDAVLAEVLGESKK
ncbi:MAG: SGNH/GDSL hydrolase family protein [Candidatus Hydrogenedentales bacterium]|jgi:lysophospholipase L1-like esterase